jgi:hypothetical protein
MQPFCPPEDFDLSPTHVADDHAHNHVYLFF